MKIFIELFFFCLMFNVSNNETLFLLQGWNFVLISVNLFVIKLSEFLST